MYAALEQLLLKQKFSFVFKALQMVVHKFCKSRTPWRGQVAVKRII